MKPFHVNTKGLIEISDKKIISDIASSPEVLASAASSFFNRAVLW